MAECSKCQNLVPKRHLIEGVCPGCRTGPHELLLEIFNFMCSHYYAGYFEGDLEVEDWLDDFVKKMESSGYVYQPEES